MKVNEKFRNLVSKLSEGAGTFLMFTLYFVVGLVMAVPYTYLAGWDANSLTLTAFALPITALILGLLYTAYKMKRYDTPWWIQRTFYGLLGYSLLPIFANGISVVLKWAGLATVSGFVFEYRYTSLVVVPIISIIGLVTYSFAKSAWRQRFSDNATPPSNTPSSNGFGPSNATVSPREERKTDTGTFQLVSV